MRPIVALLIIAPTASVATAQWTVQPSGTKAGLRGLSVANADVAWASGTGGTVIRTVDGGKTWGAGTVPEADDLDFRDIEAFDERTAYALSIGAGETSRIYKTTDGGATWELTYRNQGFEGGVMYSLSASPVASQWRRV